MPNHAETNLGQFSGFYSYYAYAQILRVKGLKIKNRLNIKNKSNAKKQALS
jgi:hypothetical protein